MSEETKAALSEQERQSRSETALALGNTPKDLIAFQDDELIDMFGPCI